MKLTNLLFILVLGFMVSSCADKDETAPTITLSEPMAGLSVEAGGTFNIVGQVTDNEELAKITISDGNSNTDITTFNSATSHDLNVTVTVNEASPAGTLTITITAEDAEGNTSTETAEVTVVEAAGCEPAASCVVAGQTTIVVITPETTPADAQIEIVGSFNGWPGDLDANFVLTQNGENCYCIPVNFDDGAEFKFRRDGSWDKVEKDAAGGEVANRVFTPTPDGVITITVENWADL